jgi:hypothetical protein
MWWPQQRAGAPKAAALPQAGPSEDRLAWVMAGAAATVAVVAMAYRLGGPLTGFHMFNEGFYLLNGIKDAQRSLAGPIISPLDPNNPFIYPLALAVALKTFGSSIATARGLSVLAAGATVVFTFLAGKELYNSRIGALAACALSVTPGFLLVGRNIQIDSLMLAVMMAAMWAWLRAVRTGTVRWSITAGVLLAAGLLTKLPSLLLIAAFVAWRVLQTRPAWRLPERVTWIAVLVATLTAAPWYVYRALSSAEFVGAQRHLASIAQWNGFGYLWKFVFLQQFWMLSPLIALAALASAALMVRRRQPADMFLLTYLAVHLAVYCFYNYHAYYFLPLAPVAALAIGRGAYAAGARSWRAVITLAVVIALLTVPFSALMLAGKKFSSVRLDQTPGILEGLGYRPSDTTVAVWDTAYGQYGPALDYYLQMGGFRSVEFSVERPFQPPGTARVVLFAGALQEPSSAVRLLRPLEDELVAPVAFGYAFRQPLHMLAFFELGSVQVVRVGPLWGFGVESRRVPSPFSYLYDLAVSPGS